MKVIALIAKLLIAVAHAQPGTPITFTQQFDFNPIPAGTSGTTPGFSMDAFLFTGNTQSQTPLMFGVQLELKN